jgi:hypothetical protein
MKTITHFILLILLQFGAAAQFTNVMIDNNFGPEEPSITINPLNANEMVAGSNQDNAYRSNDGGATWFSDVISSSLGEAGDPCLTSDSLGNLFYFHLVNTLDKVACQKSANGGLTYNNGSFTWNNNSLLQDKEWAVADLHSNNLYVTWTEYDDGFNPGPLDSSRIYFARSTDHGATFSNGVRINLIAGDCLYEDITDPHPFVGANGEVYVTFMDSAGIHYNKSTDFGLTWLPSQPLIAAVGAERYDSVPGVNRIRSVPYSCSDNSNSIYRGNIYTSWSDQRNGTNNSDVFFIKSMNGASTWTPPLKVNSDNSGNHQYRNAMAVDQTNGYIYIVYYDRRNYVNNDSTDVYLAKSTDGGDTWTDIKISNSGFYSAGFVFDGDYIDISAHAGIVRPIWTRVDNFNTSIWTCLYDESTVGITTAINPLQNSFSVNPNPADIVATISFKGMTDQQEVSILDASGRILKSFIMNHELEREIDLHDFNAGIYFVRAGLETHKLVIEK